MLLKSEFASCFFLIGANFTCRQWMPICSICTHRGTTIADTRVESRWCRAFIIIASRIHQLVHCLQSPPAATCTLPPCQLVRSVAGPQPPSPHLTTVPHRRAWNCTGTELLPAHHLCDWSGPVSICPLAGLDLVREAAHLRVITGQHGPQQSIIVDALLGFFCTKCTTRPGARQPLSWALASVRHAASTRCTGFHCDQHLAAPIRALYYLSNALYTRTRCLDLPPPILGSSHPLQRAMPLHSTAHPHPHSPLPPAPKTAPTPPMGLFLVSSHPHHHQHHHHRRLRSHPSEKRSRLVQAVGRRQSYAALLSSSSA